LGGGSGRLFESRMGASKGERRVKQGVLKNGHRGVTKVSRGGPGTKKGSVQRVQEVARARGQTMIGEKGE